MFKSEGPELGTVVMSWRSRKEASVASIASLGHTLGTRKCQGPAELQSSEPSAHPCEEREEEPLRKGRG